MDDTTAAKVWEQFALRIPTTGVGEANTLLAFSQWVGLKSGALQPAPVETADESDEE